MRKVEAVYSELDTVRQCQLLLLVLWQRLKDQERRRKATIVEKKKKVEGSRYALTRGCWNGEHISSLTRR